MSVKDAKILYKCLHCGLLKKKRYFRYVFICAACAAKGIKPYRQEEGEINNDT